MAFINDKGLLEKFLTKTPNHILYVCAVGDELDAFLTVAEKMKITTSVLGQICGKDLIALYDTNDDESFGWVYCAGITYFNSWRIAPVIEKYKPSCVVGFGTAAAVCSAYKVGDIMVTDDTACNDLDLTVFGYNRGRLTKGEIPHVPVQVSGSRFLNSTADKNKLKDEFITVKGFDMESFMWQSICQAYEIPFISARGVSDDGTNESENSYEQNAHRASINVSKWILTRNFN